MDATILNGSNVTAPRACQVRINGTPATERTDDADELRRRIGDAEDLIGDIYSAARALDIIKEQHFDGTSDEHDALSWLILQVKLKTSALFEHLYPGSEL